MGLQTLVLRLQEEVPNLIINVWYLDDGFLVGSLEDIQKALEILIQSPAGIGLQLNLRKTSFW
jgi:hypothetical protein